MNEAVGNGWLGWTRHRGALLCFGCTFSALSPGLVVIISRLAGFPFRENARSSSRRTVHHQPPQSHLEEFHGFLLGSSVKLYRVMRSLLKGGPLTADSVVMREQQSQRAGGRITAPILGGKPEAFPGLELSAPLRLRYLVSRNHKPVASYAAEERFELLSIASTLCTM
ncbi:hypothetical protein LY76DRAFT_186756 [Colletotrichum caudatum]|nr:hypothetical protein LY76DRAFT_186756 [Colletotrichum caudatum]